MAAGTQVDLKDCTLTFKDGTGTPNTLTMELAEGTLNVVEGTPVEFKPSRGKIANGSVRKATEVPMEVEFDLIFRHITASSGDDASPKQFLERTGPAAAFVSTGDACDPYCVDIEIVKDNSVCSGSVEDETYTLSKFYAESKSYNFEEGTLSVSGRCKATSMTSARA